MTIYSDVTKYAKECGITSAQAKLRCDHFLKLNDEAEKARVCPECKQQSLIIEHSDCEYSSTSWVQCEECDFTDDVDKEQYIALQHWYDFDDVLAIACTEMETGIKDWNAFVEQSNKDLTK
ncbi:hypothetical protein [Bacillus cereus]|uniref:hypothetical protein n=1 Tax=Bacillus cereus TaxID=1396 RepID=UPI00077AF9D7|nr:hypothetical protein [Bacillus cereus]KXY16187.1 hypothetical protein AT273_09905 [Bacillus cereus]